MTQFFTEHKRKLTVAIVAVIAVLFFIYLYAFSRPGVWHEDTFLYRQKDGSFRGSDVFAEYEMHIVQEEGFNTEIDFKVNDTLKSYKLSYSPIANSSYWNLEIFENGTSVFKGKTISNDPVMLMDENEKLDIYFSVGTTSDFFETPTTEELFPTNAKLANWTFGGIPEVRGNLTMLIMIFVFSLILGLDLAFPQLFFNLEHGLDVTGGEPSDFFLIGQKIGRFFLAIAIPVCVILSFIIH